MSAEFYIKQNKKNDIQFVLKVNEHKFTLSNPKIQPFNEYFIENVRDILYYYYDLKIEKIYTNSKLKTVTDSSIFEFGAITRLPEFIDNVLSFDIFSLNDKNYLLKRDGNEIVEDKNNWEIFKQFRLNGMLREDCYYITKIGRFYDEKSVAKKNTKSNSLMIKKYKNLKETMYELYIGCGNDELYSNIAGITMSVNEEDLKIVKQWAEEFVKYSIATTKNAIEEIFNQEYENVELDEEDKNEYYFPYLLKKYFKENYPEDMDKFRNLYIKLYSESDILKELYQYIQNEPIDEPLFSRYNPPFTAKSYMEKGLKVWEAYEAVFDEYRKIMYEK